MAFPVVLPSRVRSLVLAQARDVEQSARRMRDDPASAEDLHAFRRDARRLAAAVSLLEFDLRPTTFAKASALCVGLARGLGRHRDADVLLRLVDDLAAGASDAARRDLRPARRALKRQAAAGRARRVVRCWHRARPRGLRRRLEPLLAEAVDRPRDVLSSLVRNLAERSRDAFEPAPKEAHLHGFRLSLKAVRYGAEAIAGELPQARALFATVAREADEASQILGEWRNARTLAAFTARTVNGRAAALLRSSARKAAADRVHEFQTGWSEHRWPALEAAIREAHAETLS